MHNLAHHDFETFSPVDIRATGADPYSEHPECEVLCMAFEIPGKTGKTVQLWKPGDDYEPSEFLEWIAAGKPIAAHNSYFEWCIWRNVLSRQCPNWPQPKLEQFHDTMAWAHAAALPGALGDCADALGLDQRKDKDGARVMRKLTKPRAWNEDGTYTRWLPEDAPTDFEILYAYCKQDVVVEREIASRLRPLSPLERQVWLIDQRINARGVRLDRDAIEAAMRVIADEAKRLNTAMAEVTGGAVKTTTNVGKLKDFFADCGWFVDTVDKNAISEILAKDSDAPAEVKAAARIRKEAGKTSTAKLKKMLSQITRDGTAKGQYVYHGPTTGRWASKGIQLQNMARPKLDAGEVADAIKLLDLPGGADAIRHIYGDPLDVVSWSLRGMIIPGRGNVFEGGDFSNIEGRTIAWLAGETWKLQAFRDFDAGRGADAYKLAYAHSFGCDPADVSSDQRQIGKCQELGLGFAGGVGALRTMAKTYGVSLHDMAEAIFAVTDADAWARAEAKRLFLQIEHGQHTDLPPKVYTAARVLVDAWRDAHPMTRKLWADMNECAMSAVANRGEKFTISSGMITWVCGKDFLYMRLPSGRLLSYARPSLVWQENIFTGRPEQVLQYWAVGKDKAGSRKPKFEPVRSHGGLTSQNATQATARDVQAAAMLRFERAGRPIVLHTHDELRCQIPKSKTDLALCKRLMEEPPAWAAGLPIAAEVETMERYHK